MKKNLMNYLTIIVSAVTLFLTSVTAQADTAAEIDRDVDRTIHELYATSPSAKELSKVAKAMLVFPEIVKSGLIIGGQYG